MAEIERQTIPTSHNPEEVWGALNTPLLGEFEGVLQPVARANYDGLSDDGEIQLGTLITYELDADAIVAALGKKYPMLSMVKSKLQRDIALRVEEHNPQEMVRVDTLEIESQKHSATVRQRVEGAGNGTGVLIVEGELSLGGSMGAAQSMLMPIVHNGIQEQGQRVMGRLLG